MKNRTLVLAVSVLCVGIMIMPYTVSLFSTQHDWKAGADVNCMTCHTDITEPGASYMHGSMTSGTAQEYCTSCHQLGTPGSGDGVTGDGGFDDEHAAVSVECLDCHETSQSAGAISDVWYSGTGAEDALANKAFINNATEAHSNMTGTASLDEGAWASDYLAGNNEACIACHTNVTLETYLTVTAQTLNITASENIWGNWTVTFTAKP